MPKIISFGGHGREKENIFKSLWEQFKELDKPIKIMFVSLLLISLSTPAIVLNYQVFKSRAQTVTSDSTITLPPSQAPQQQSINPDRCLAYENVSAEISCEDALKQAFTAYPGEIFNVEFKEISYKADRNASRVSVSSWLVYIYPQTKIQLPPPSGEIKSIAVAVHPLAPKAYISTYFEENQ